MSTGDDQEAERVDRAEVLASAAMALTSQVTTLSSDIDELARRAKRAEHFILLITLSLIVDFILTITVSYLVINTISTQYRIETLCPLYAFTLGTYAPMTRKSGSDRDIYVEQFGDMRAKFQALGCGPGYPLVPGAANQKPAGMGPP